MILICTLHGLYSLSRNISVNTGHDYRHISTTHFILYIINTFIVKCRTEKIASESLKVSKFKAIAELTVQSNPIKII